MGSLVPKKPTIDAPSQPPPAPSVANSQGAFDAVARQVALKQGRGRASTMLTGGQGLENKGLTARKVLYGGVTG